MNISDQREELRELLPWYENGTLHEDEREAVRSLLATDFEANRQRRELRALRGALEDEPMLAPNMAANLRRMHARIEHPQALRVKTRWLALAAFVILATGAATFFVGMRWGTYRTLTADAGNAASVPLDAELLRVDVASDVDAATLVRISEDRDVRVLRGPSQYGVATLAVPRARAPQIIARLNADPRLRFVTEVPR